MPVGIVSARRLEQASRRPASLIAGIVLAATLAGDPATAADALITKAPAPSATTNEFARAFWYDSALTVHLRTYYLDRTTPTPPGPAAWAGGGWLGYQSGWFANVFRIGVVGYTSQPIWAPIERDGNLLLKPGQQGISVIGEAYGQLKLWDQIFTGYRQGLNEPEVNPRDIRMVPNLFEAYTLQSKVGDFSYIAGLVTRIKPLNNDRFLNMAEQAGAPVGVSEAMWLGRISYSPIKDFTARLSSYHVPNILSSTYADFVWLVAVSELYKVRFGGQFMYQNSAGDNLLTGSTFHTWAGGAKVDVIVGPVTGTVAYNQTDRATFYRSPYGSWAGYTSMIVKDFNRAGETALLVGATIDFASVNLPGLSFFTNLVFGGNAINPVTGSALSDNNEYDFTLDYRFTAAYWPEILKPLWLRLRYARIEETLNGNTGVTNDYRVIVNYEWVFKSKT